MFLILNVKANPRKNESKRKNEILHNLYERLYRENRHPLLLRIKRIGKFFPQDLSSGPKIEVEELSLKEIAWIKEIKKRIESLTSEISEQVNERLNHSFREKLLGEWQMGRQIVKEIEEIEKEILKKIK